MTQKDNTDDSRIDTIGRAIANPQRYDAHPAGLVFKAIHETIGLLGLAALTGGLAVFSIWSAYQSLLVRGGLFGGINGLLAIICAIALALITFCFVVFWRLDEGETTEIVGVTFRN